MANLTETAYKGGIFSGGNPVGQPPPAHAYRDGSLGQPPPAHAYRDGSLGALGQPPPAHAYRDGSLGVLSGVACAGCNGSLGQPPPAHAYRDGSLGQDEAAPAPTAPSAGRMLLFGAVGLTGLWLVARSMK